jgi:hypothetical protein
MHVILVHRKQVSEGLPFLGLVWFGFAVLGLELRAYTFSHPTILFFVKGFFKIGSLELFARAGFEPWILLISASRVPRIIGVSHRHPVRIAI